MHEFTDKSHQNKQGFEGTLLLGERHSVREKAKY